MLAENTGIVVNKTSVRRNTAWIFFSFYSMPMPDLLCKLISLLKWIITRTFVSLRLISILNWNCPGSIITFAVHQFGFDGLLTLVVPEKPGDLLSCSSSAQVTNPLISLFVGISLGVFHCDRGIMSSSAGESTVWRHREHSASLKADRSDFSSQLYYILTVQTLKSSFPHL